MYKGKFLAYHRDPNAGPDTEYALHYRHYNPATGRFKSEDPAEDDLNLYRYVQNNPVNEADPSGLDAIYYSDTFTSTGGNPFARGETVPHNGSGVYWNVLTTAADGIGPQIPYAAESFYIGTYDASTNSIKLADKVGGGTVSRQFLDEFAASRSLLADSSGESRKVEIGNPVLRLASGIYDYFTSERPNDDAASVFDVASAITDVKGAEAFTNAVDAEYRRLLEENPQGWPAWLTEKAIGLLGEELGRPAGKSYDEQLLAMAEWNVMSELKTSLEQVEKDRLQQLVESGTSTHDAALQARIQAEASTGIDPDAIESWFAERTRESQTALAGTSTINARKALRLLGLGKVSARLLKVGRRLGLKGLRKYFEVRQLGKTALAAFDAATTQLHHAIPSFLGGLAKGQDLLGLPARLHTVYHKMLREALEARGLRSLIGPSIENNLERLRKNPDDLKGAYDAIVDSASRFDLAHPGYDVTKKFWENYAKGQFEIAPFVD